MLKTRSIWLKFATRRAYIDVMLTDAAGNAVELVWRGLIDTMPNKSNLGFADYVLMGNDGGAAGNGEAKKTSVDVAVGRQRTKLYADNLEKRFGRRPIIFLTNGYDTRIWIDQEQRLERVVSGIYAKRLKKFRSKMTMRAHLYNVRISDDIFPAAIAKEAIKAVLPALLTDAIVERLFWSWRRSGWSKRLFRLSMFWLKTAGLKIFSFWLIGTTWSRKRKGLSIISCLTCRLPIWSKIRTMAMPESFQHPDDDGAHRQKQGWRRRETIYRCDLIVVDEAHRMLQQI